MAFQYPTDDLDRSRKLLEPLGSFWLEHYGGREQVLTYAGAVGQLWRQVWQNLQEAVATTAREQIPIQHLDRWHQLTLVRSEGDYEDANLLHFGDAAQFGPQDEDGYVYSYGIPRTGARVSFPLPDGLTFVPLISNRISAPSVTWIYGIDFFIDQDTQRLLLHVDPFADARFPQQAIWETDEPTDSMVTLWLCRAEFDWRYLDEQLGYLFQLQLPSSHAYRELLNALLDAITGATSSRDVARLLTACTGIPLASGTETVEQIVRDARAQYIVTDQRVYSVAKTATPLVAIGETLVPQQALTTGLQLWSLQQGELPAEVTALSLGPGLLQGTYLSELLFENREVPLQVTTDDDGYTRVEFEISGFPADVTQFWDQVHAAGRAAEQTLAHLLDQRSQPSGEPTAHSLPATINPAQFLAANFFRQNVLLAYIRVDEQGPERMGLSWLRLLRKILPPHQLLLVVLALETGDDSDIIAGADDVGTLLATDFTDDGRASGVDTVLRPRVVRGHCQ